MKLQNIPVLCLLLYAATGYAAPNDTLPLSLQQLIATAQSHSRQLKLSQAAIDVAKAMSDEAKLSKLPYLNFTADAGYLGNVAVIGLGSMPSGSYAMPHFSNNYGLMASYIVYAGDKLNTGIKLASIEERIAGLNYERANQDVKLILSGYYLDLYSLLKQRRVYEENIAESKLLQDKIKNRYDAGTALKSDFVRSELLVANMELALLKLNNNIDIINNKLVEMVDLPEHTVIVPEEISGVDHEGMLAGSKAKLPEQERAYPGYENTMPAREPSLPEYQKTAALYNPDLATNQLAISAAEKSFKMVRADRLPSISLFATSNFNRPFIYDLPAIDIYSNLWMAGVRLNYDIGSLYTNKRKSKTAEQRITQARMAATLGEERVRTTVYEAYKHYRESIDQLTAMEKELALANENYRRVTNSYNQQLMLITDVMDASNARLSAELQLQTAQAHIAFTYYQLLRTTGKL